jgi:hypothetical protein
LACAFAAIAVVFRRFRSSSEQGGEDAAGLPAMALSPSAAAL